MENFKLDTLKDMIGESIKITDETSQTEIETTIKKVLPSPMNGEEWEAFSTLMQAEAGSPCLSQGTYRISNSKLGEGAMFISPNSPTEYEIIVTRKNNQT